MAYFNYIIFFLIISVSLSMADIPACAFSITTDLPASDKSFVPSITYETENGISGILTRQPIEFASSKRGGTEEFLAALGTEFPSTRGWIFVPAKEDLQGHFSVVEYYVFFNGKVGGGGFGFNYIHSGNDPVTDDGTELHWIQRVVSNHKRRSGHGTSENRIGIKSSVINKVSVPFFDVVPKNKRRNPPPTKAVPPHFEYDVARDDLGNDHEWRSETYLVSINRKSPKTVTVHNGVSWGWKNVVNREAPQEVRN
ncbi:MAG: hypothetical protein RW306_19805 [Geobacteraceae bacterium]|nr:hypothetical protein [Geobacteraceae bacterium]